jgi:hypothetical protein
LALKPPSHTVQLPLAQASGRTAQSGILRLNIQSTAEYRLTGGLAHTAAPLALNGRRLRERTLNGPSKQWRTWSWWYLLLLVQFIAVLWPPFFNKLEPSWIGLPFFYWYQLLGAVLTAIVYFATED